MFVNKIFILAVFAIAAGILFLLNSNIPAPQHKAEKVISNERFFK